MASSYPGATDTFTTKTNTPRMLIDAADINALADAILAIQNTLGINPQGGSATVDARLDALTVGALAHPYVLVASNDMPTAVKDAADYVCDGTADDVQINSAIDDASALTTRDASNPAGATQKGRVLLTGGRFNIAATIGMRTACTLQGQGRLTEVRAVGMGSAHMIGLRNVDDHLTVVSDLWLNGNFASGGTGDAINYDMTASGNTSTYPDTNPDSNHHIDNILITAHSNGTRNGINLHATGTANNRGNMVTRIQIRDCGGNGIWYSSASDSYIGFTHVGGCGDSGHRIEGGNTKLQSVKSFFCDVAGFTFGSGRHVVSGLEAQDNVVGVDISSSNFTGSGFCIDTSSTTGLNITASRVVLNGFSIFLRSGGRYATQTNGLVLSASRTDLNLTGTIDPTSITTPWSGTPGSRSFVRVSDGTTIQTAG